MSKLALLGGKPIRNKPFGQHPVITPTDMQKVLTPFINHCFSGFRAGKEEGGPCVVEFEDLMRSLTGAKHAVSFNTWSSGIFSMLLSLGVQPGDEVILPAYTMSACAASVLACGAVPVFADIDQMNYCLDPFDIAKKISPFTKVIMVVHLFGLPADMDRIVDVVKNSINPNIIIIEDAAQAPLATYKGRMCGLIGSVGGFSFTESKHVMSGEGGIAVTNNDQIANGLKYIRNHGEVCSLPGCDKEYFNNMVVQNNVGFNFRLTEIDAALGVSQLSRLRDEITKRQEYAYFIDEKLKNIPYFNFPKIDYAFTHSYYCYVLRWNYKTVSRDMFGNALKAEGIPMGNGYCQPIYKQHIYRDNPHWAICNRRKEITYDDLPVTETINNELLVCQDVRSPNTLKDMQNIVDGINKVVEYMSELE